MAVRDTSPLTPRMGPRPIFLSPWGRTPGSVHALMVHLGLSRHLCWDPGCLYSLFPGRSQEAILQSQRVFVLAQERNPQTRGISARTGHGADLAMASSPLWEGEPTHLREVLWSQASCPAGTALHVTWMESGLAPSGTICTSQSHLTMVKVGDTVGNLEALAKAQPVPCGVLAEAAP